MNLPVTLNIAGPVVIFGAGPVGAHKAAVLSRFTDDILVVARTASGLPAGVTVIKDTVDSVSAVSHIPDDAALVIAALNDKRINHAIAAYCRERNILVNVVDDPAPSTVYIPALSRAGDITIAVSTAGTCPFYARKVREELDETIDERACWLAVLAAVRALCTDAKNDRLERVYADTDVAALVRAGDIAGAIEKAREVADVSR